MNIFGNKTIANKSPIISKLGIAIIPLITGSLPDASGLFFFDGCFLSASRSNKSFKIYTIMDIIGITLLIFQGQ